MAEETKQGFNLDNSGIAFALVFGAGASTALGAAAVFERRIVKIASKPILAAGLGFSGGVMLYVSFIEIFVKSLESFKDGDREEDDAYFCATLCLFSGMALLRLVQYLVHRIDHSHDTLHEGEILDEAREFGLTPPTLIENQDPEAQATPESSAAEGEKTIPAAAADGAGNAQTQNVAALDRAQDEAVRVTAAAVLAERREARMQEEKAAQLQRMGLNTAIAIAIHNFPEGLATFVATLVDPSVGATLAIAIGVHNIPEGLCVALPIYYATNSRWKGFLWAVFSGISEPVGAFIGWLVIKSTGDDMSQVVYGVLFGLVAGMMIMIVVLELLPTAYNFDPTDKYVTHSIVAGMAVMAASLCLFKV
eukprot:CAMPEP_0176024670 /NCGR_PEP_ID=MMETSP0120_2-20121206/12058_1 /TAXON_ID=160619 /ORGANISM="Kryptoperidinium foliaceum, Strain CCMP 1326" /LENGTH=363 /DNA_ID=CAMNT_0017357849 /DNA_START=52 /DNA_END=1143 /DNA_ORIENTATION=+